MRIVYMGESRFVEETAMKKLSALICLIMALVSLSAPMADAETTPTLWPAYDPVTGLWGVY